MKSESVPELDAQSFCGDRTGDDKVVIERRADIAQDVGAMVDEALVRDLPESPFGEWIGGRDRTSAVRNRI